MKKLVSILLTLAVAVSLLVVPAMVSADGGTVPVNFGPTGRTPNLEGTITEDGTNLYFSVTVLGQDEADDDYLAFWVDPDYLNKSEDLAGIVDVFAQPWNEHNKLLVLNFFTGNIEPEWGDGANGENPWMQKSKTLPAGVIVDYTDTVEGMNWEGTIPLSVLDMSAGDTFGYMFSARINSNSTKDVDGYPESSWLAGWDLRDYNTAIIPNTAAILTAAIPMITAINVDPSNVDFGTITPGTTVSGDPDPITVTNIGTVTVNVGVNLDPTGGVFQYLYLNGENRPGGSWSAGQLGMVSILPTLSRDCTTKLDVPETYSAKGVETTTLVFTATAV